MKDEYSAHTALDQHLPGSETGPMMVATLRRVVGVLVFLSACSGFLAAEPTNLGSFLGDAVSVRTVSGAIYQGVLQQVMEDRVELLVPDGEIVQLARSQIETVTAIVSTAGGRGFYEDSASNRLIIMPTGFPMDAGEFQVADQEIIAVTGSYGINDWLSVWGGVSIPGAVFSLRGSVTLGETTGLSAGTFVGISWFGLVDGPVVLPYALASIGEEDNNFTVGSGFMMTFVDGFRIPGAVLTLGGKRTLTSSTAIVTENWIVWAERWNYLSASDTVETYWSAVPLVVAPAVAFRIANNRLSWDIGAVVPFIIQNGENRALYLVDPVIPIPILSLTYRIQ
ncbi:MAG: hypothetical protein E4H09_01515 [Spirochaetales bacterium]|nr:MAG: hypothetical protein E4H09_01515 [Spirochaetales bacterium]